MLNDTVVYNNSAVYFADNNIDFQVCYFENRIFHNPSIFRYLQAPQNQFKFGLTEKFSFQILRGSDNCFKANFEMLRQIMIKPGSYN